MRGMDPFVRRLVERLHAPAQPLSRNRHFHTFDNPLGRTALKVSRVLKALQKDLLACRAEGGVPQVSRLITETGERVELKLPRHKGLRTTRLEPAEYELLCALPGVKEALGGRKREG